MCLFIFESERRKKVCFCIFVFWSSFQLLIPKGAYNRNWKMRWFILQEENLFYFSNSTCQECLGSIPLNVSFHWITREGEANLKMNEGREREREGRERGRENDAEYIWRSPKGINCESVHDHWHGKELLWGSLFSFILFTQTLSC